MSEHQPPSASELQAEFLISDLETVRIVAEPIRLRILELLVLGVQPVKQLAKTLKLPQTKLYYHINLLEERGLIRVVSTRVVSGIIEKQYGAVARSYRVDQSLLTLGNPARSDTLDLMVGSMLDSLRSELHEGVANQRFDLRDEAPVERRITFARAPLRLSAERAEELHQRLSALFTEFCADSAADRSAPTDTQLYHLFVAYFPTSAQEEAEEQG